MFWFCFFFVRQILSINFQRLISLTSLVFFLTVAIAPCFSFPAPVYAILQEYHAAPGVMAYKSRFSVRDSKGNAWQIIFFRDQKETSWRYNLRIVAFPGSAEFLHPEPLEIITQEAKLIVAPDVFATGAPAANVGQFDITKLVEELPDKGDLKLSFALANNQDFRITIPEAIVLEWQWLSKDISTLIKNI